jgi:hypothetical protein
MDLERMNNPASWFPVRRDCFLFLFKLGVNFYFWYFWCQAKYFDEYENVRGQAKKSLNKKVDITAGLI